MKKYFSIIAVAAAMTNAWAGGDTLKVTEFRHYGPVPVYKPFMLDSTDVNGKKFDDGVLKDLTLNHRFVKEGTPWSGEELPGADTTALHLLGVTVTNRDYFVGNLNLAKAPKDYALFVDGEKRGAGPLSLKPGTHNVVLQYMSTPRQTDSLQMHFATDSAKKVSAMNLELGDAANGKRIFTIEQLTKACSYSSYTLSPDGKWMILTILQKNLGRDGEWKYYLLDRARNVQTQLPGWSAWMPKSNRYYYTRNVGSDRQIVSVDPATRTEEIFAHYVPEGGIQIFPTEDRVLLSQRQDGPKELNPDAFEIIHPDDRQPGWRDRTKYAIYHVGSGVMQPLTFGWHGHWVSNISHDGTKLLISESIDRLEARPTNLSTLLLLDLATLQCDTIYAREGFASGGIFSPDDKQVLVQGSPEAFGRVGCTLPDDVIPSMYDYQLYCIDIDTKKVTPLTRDFTPSINSYDWSSADGKIYICAEDRDLVALFRLDPKTLKYERIAQPEEVVANFELAANAPVMSFAAESNNHSWRLYSLDLGKKGKLVQHDEINRELYEGVEADSCMTWYCKNSIGDNVCCRYYKPANFDETKKYPMIVYYYGGCSPTSRYFEFSYPAQIWAANGYAVLVVNPSGAAGFGQEWSARHVNTAGKDPARDIIEATKTFCKEHAWVNAEKLGCIGASYGGFMTQYLQTKTDIFRCAISHAGISDHTTYWGLGYWGYTYSEVSMAGSYPWTRKDLYVDESPIYNVDKIKSSMLFLHGTVDTNVPINNSIQMYTALKLLGQDVAFVNIEGENHGIRDAKKRILWHNVTMAWFARCLKDDATWWEALYPKKNL